MTPFEVNIEFKDDFAVMKLSGSSTAVSKQSEDVINLRDEFKKIVKDKNYTNVIVDLYNVEYIASDTIGAILSGNSMINKAGGKLVLCRPSSYVSKIFEIVKLSDVLPILSTYEDAVEEIKK